LSTTNPTWLDPGANPVLRGERPTTNNLNHGTELSEVLTAFFTALMMEAVRTSDTSVSFYETAWNSIPEDS
jgi:hypothetical protein